MCRPPVRGAGLYTEAQCGTSPVWYQSSVVPVQCVCVCTWCGMWYVVYERARAGSVGDVDLVCLCAPVC